MPISIHIDDAGNLTEQERGALAAFLEYGQEEYEYTLPAAATQELEKAVNNWKATVAPAAPVVDTYTATEVTITQQGAVLTDVTEEEDEAFAAIPAVTVPPPPAAVAPPPPPAPIGAFNQVTRDAKNLPWDARIHASSKAKVADGTWRYKRGVTEEEIARVEAELRGIVGTTIAPPAGLAPPPPPPAAPAANGGFKEFMEWALPLVTTKILTVEQILGAAKEVGVKNGLIIPHLGALAISTEIIPEVRTRVEMLIPKAVS